MTTPKRNSEVIAEPERAHVPQPERVAVASQEFVGRAKAAGLRPTLVRVHSGQQRTGWRRQTISIDQTHNGWTVRAPFAYDGPHGAGTIPGIYVLDDGSVMIGGAGEAGPILGTDYATNSQHGADEIIQALSAFLAEHNA